MSLTKSRISMVLLALTMVVALATAASAYDLGGRTVTFVHLGNMENQFADGENLAHLEWVEEQFNVNIEFVQQPWPDIYHNFVPSVMAGDPPGDVYEWSYGWMWGVLPDGVLYPLDDVLDDAYWESLPPMHQEYMRNAVEFGGTQYGFSRNHLGGNRGIIWNKSLFEREGFPNLYEMVDYGEWDWDAFKEIAIQATYDSTGDGQIDKYGFGTFHGYAAGESVSYWVPYYFAYANDAAITRTIDGQETFTFGEPEALAAFELWHELTQVHNAVLPVGHTDARALFAAGDVAMMDGALWDLGWLQNNMEDDYGFVYFPKGPNATEYGLIDRGDLFFYVLPVTVEQPREVIEVANALFRLTSPYLDHDRYMENLVDSFSMNVRDWETLEMYQESLFNRNIFYYRNIPNLRTAVTRIVNGEISAAAGIAEIATEAQAHLDEYFGSW